MPSSTMHRFSTISSTPITRTHSSFYRFIWTKNCMVLWLRKAARCANTSIDLCSHGSSNRSGTRFLSATWANTNKLPAHYRVLLPGASLPEGLKSSLVQLLNGRPFWSPIAQEILLRVRCYSPDWQRALDQQRLGRTQPSAHQRFQDHCAFRILARCDPLRKRSR